MESKLAKGAMQLNRERNGIWKNLAQVVRRLITRVVSQVRGPLEAEGKAMKPTLIHGDLWDGNVTLETEGSTSWMRASTMRMVR